MLLLLWGLSLEICLPFSLDWQQQRTVFRKKLHTKRTTCIQLYNYSGHYPWLNIICLCTNDRTQMEQSFLSFGCIQSHRDEKFFFSFKRETRGGSRGDGQVHILLFGRGGRYGNVIVLFLRASGCWQGRAFAVMWSSPLAAALTLLFVLHSAVLEPYFHLFLRQVQIRGDLDASQSGEVHVGGELALQLQKLRAGEGRAHALAALKFSVGVFCRKVIRTISNSDIL